MVKFFSAPERGIFDQAKANFSGRKNSKYLVRTIENKNHNRGEASFDRKNEESPFEESQKSTQEKTNQ